MESHSNPQLIEDFQLTIASINGSGTLTSNRILHKTLIRHGYHVVGKNLFPSNIEGLPTYYFLRISKTANTLKTKNELYIGLNPSTFARDSQTLINDQTLIFTNADLKINTPKDSLSISFKSTIANAKAPIKIKKRMSNLSYVGWVGNHLGLDVKIIEDVVRDQFSKESVIAENLEVMLEGWNLYDQVSKVENKSLVNVHISMPRKDNSNKVSMEGNQASALGWVDGGCQIATWYPITPSTSLVESFELYSKGLREQKSSTAIIQSEDEISAISSVIGAGWTGARAATATSGPGLSLMSEAIGLSYFAEIPSVICDVQRTGPSTGLPTRTSQGDLEFAFKCSHGDTFHPILLPSNPQECYQMSALSFDLADKYLTPVLVLSDLDLGMNLWTCDEFSQVKSSFDRKQTLDEMALEKIYESGEEFKRYQGDDRGLTRRTLPGTHHPKASYFTRGSGHNESANYSESPEDYENLITRLKTKIMSSRLDLPQPIISKTPVTNSKRIGAIFYGSSSQIFPEVQELISCDKLSTCEIKALPLHNDVLDFIKSQDLVFVVEQNRDGQMKNIIKQSFDFDSSKLVSITQFNGWSIQADIIAEKINQQLKVQGGQS